jgi:predicted secreted protein
MKITALTKLMLMLLPIGILVLGFSIQRVDGAEPPVTEWIKAYGGANSEVARSVIQTSDGGYLLTGETASFGAGGKDFWLVKTDASGNMEWNNTYGGASNDMAFSVVEAGDGYTLTGRTNSFGVGIADFWLVKVDSSGNHEWNKTYGGSGADAARCVINTGDGGYVLAGFTQSFGAGGQDFWLVKVDSSGNHEWNKTYGGSGADAARCVINTGDGGYILTGETNSFGSGDTDFWLVKVDSSGNHEWNKTYGGSGAENAFSVVKTGDGGYALAGRTGSFGEGRLDFWLVKVDSSGGHEWNKTYGGAGNDPAHSMVEANLVKTGDGGYVLAGFTQSFGAGGQDGWLIKTDAAGNMEWNNTYGGVEDDVLNSVVTSSDGGYVLAGFTQSFGAGGQDFWLVKIAGPTKYPLSIHCSPVEVTFTIDSVPHITPWCETYEEGTTVDLVMPETYTVAQARYYWSQWSDGNTSRLRTIAINTNITLTAYYTGPYYKLSIVSLPITGIAFTVNGAAQTTPYTKWLLEGSYTLEMPETYDGYVWSHWLEDVDTNRIKMVTLPAATYTAVYTTTPVGGTTVSIESRHLNPCITSIFIIVSIVSISGIYLGRRYAKE